MKKKFSFFILFILVNLAAIAQQEPLFSNYMFTRSIANPSFVGAEKTINAIFSNRTMFAGFGEGKPVTSVFGVEAPVEIMGSKSGLGLLIISDEVGFYNSVSVDASYAYHHTLQGGNLGGGITLGMNNLSLAFGEAGGWYIPDDDDNFHTVDGDDYIPDPFSTLTLGVDVGLYYETPKYFIGFSVANVNSSKIVFSKSNQADRNVGFYAPHAYLTGTYNIELPDPLFDLKPSFMLRSDFAAYMLDLNGTVYYKKKYWGGLGFRLSPRNFAAVTLLGGLELMNGLNFVYAMDVNTSAIILHGATSHEILITYSFNLDTKRDQKYKSVRFL